jgi:hypothetical protein
MRGGNVMIGMCVAGRLRRVWTRLVVRSGCAEEPGYESRCADTARFPEEHGEYAGSDERYSEIEERLEAQERGATRRWSAQHQHTQAINQFLETERPHTVEE